MGSYSYIQETLNGLNVAKSSDKKSKRAVVYHECHQEPLTPAAKTLLDLHDKKQLTIHQVKDHKDTLTALIKVCQNGCMQV